MFIEGISFPTERLYIALRTPNRIDSVVKHEDNALVFAWGDQKIMLDNAGNTIRRYAYHYNDFAKHGVEEILGCQFLDVVGVARLVRKKLMDESGATYVKGSEKRVERQSEAVNDCYFDIEFKGERYEVGVHLAKLDSGYVRSIGWSVNVTYMDKAKGQFPCIAELDQVCWSFCQ